MTDPLAVSGRAAPPPEALLTASRRLLRPLVRLLMRAGITFPVMADLVRGLFVEVALTELLDSPKARTDSRVSLLTGVHRKEIRRLRELPPDTSPIPPTVTTASQIIARWLGSPLYTNFNGAPLPLPRAAPEGEPSFDALVSTVTTDIRPRAVLDDWISQGIVTLEDGDLVRLNVAAFVPRADGEARIFYFARNLHDHIAAAAANVSAVADPPFLDRAVHYDGLDEATAQTLEEVARVAARGVLLEVNRAALALAEAMPAAGAFRERVNFGVYVYREEEPPA